MLDQLILENQNHPLVFERFCAALISESEGITLVTTSFNYDRGRDARSVQATRGKLPFVLCVTLSRELDPKVSADILKLVKRCNPETLYYCSSLRLTEDAIIKIEAEIRSLVSQPISVRGLGSIQLADISSRFPKILAHHYRSEIDNIKSILDAREARASDTEAHGLRMALMAYGSDDAQQLRENMSCQMALDALRLGEDTAEGISQRITRDLSLPRGLSLSYIGRILDSAVLKGFAVNTGDTWSLTASGMQEITTVPSAAAANLLEGRNLIRTCLENLIGQKISNAQYEQTWITLLDGLSELFHSNGIGIVEAVSAFLNESDVTEPKDLDLPRLMARIAIRVKAIFATEELGAQVVKAVRDMFTERDGEAFDWIAGICERFVTMCSLGLESTTSDEIRPIITRSQLVLDTDMALTLLSVSEPDHNSLKELVASWKRIGGKFLLSIPVLEEVAYHAWISENDLNGSRSLLGQLKGQDLRRYSDNTFVRAFHAIAKSRADEKFWPDYIASYRGTTPYDYSNVRRHLAQVLSVETLPDSTDTRLEGNLMKQLLDLRKPGKVANSKNQSRHGAAVQDYKEKEQMDKAKRDGRLLASISRARLSQEELGTDKTVVLITSSRRLQFIAKRNRASFGHPDPVLSLGALSYLISLFPNVRLGPDTLRRALFEFGESARLQDHQKLALRVIKGSGLYQMPWATRDQLTHKLDRVLYEEATKRNVVPSTFKRSFAAGDPQTDPAAIIAKSLERLSLPSEIQNEVEELRRKLQSAQLEIEFLRESSTTRPQKDKSKLN